LHRFRRQISVGLVDCAAAAVGVDYCDDMRMIVIQFGCFLQQERRLSEYSDYLHCGRIPPPWLLVGTSLPPLASTVGLSRL